MSKVKNNKKYYHRKLVRDRIPEIIESAGDSYKARTLNLREYRKLLRKKLVEEAKELENARRDELTNELADVLQLVKSIAEFEGITLKSIEAKRRKKEKRVGVFKKRIFLIWSDKPAGSK
jgi:predicted house-cleaning noncanonical NTP pyrophosphatase (MazG superfamily)